MRSCGNGYLQERHRLDFVSVARAIVKKPSYRKKDAMRIPTMNTYKYIGLTILFFAVASVSRLHGAGEPAVRRGADGSTTLTFPNGQTFSLPAGKGLLGPSSNPTSQTPFANADGSLIAVNEQPMTKTSFVHLYIRGADGRFTEIKNANQKIGQAAPASAQKIDTDFIRVERLSGKTLDLETEDFGSKPTKRLLFKVTIAADGAISAAH